MNERTKKVIELLNAGMTMPNVARKLEMNYKTVEGIKRKYNLTVVKTDPSKAFNDFLDHITDDLHAYFLGFFIADGNISDEGRVSFSIAIDDEEILKKFQAISSTNPIQYSNNQNGVIRRKKQARYRFTSKKVKYVLETKYNIHPRKTYNYNFEFPFEQIPEEYWGSLIRGLWDGDGSFEFGPGTFTPRCVVNSKKFGIQVGEIIKSKTQLDYRIEERSSKTCTYWTIRLFANSINKFEKVTALYHFLYDNSTIELARKKNKVLQYLEYRANAMSREHAQCNA